MSEHIKLFHTEFTRRFERLSQAWAGQWDLGLDRTSSKRNSCVKFDHRSLRLDCRFQSLFVFVVLRNPRKSHRFQRIFDTKTVNKQPRWEKLSPDESLVARVQLLQTAGSVPWSYSCQDPHIIIMCLHVSGIYFFCVCSVYVCYYM